jgi:hypothetical protein
MSRVLTAMVFTVLLAAGWRATEATETNPLVGSWAVKDEVSGVDTTFWFMEDSVIKGPGQAPLPYWYERDGESLVLTIGREDEPPATLTFSGSDSAELQLADGVVIHLTRLEEPGVPGVAPAHPPAEQSVSSQGPLDAVPLGVPTLYEPLEQSLESLLTMGWRLEQVSGTQNGFTILIRNGERNALCVLVPPAPATGAMALSDCRRLN